MNYVYRVSYYFVTMNKDEVLTTSPLRVLLKRIEPEKILFNGTVAELTNSGRVSMEEALARHVRASESSFN